MGGGESWSSSPSSRSLFLSSSATPGSADRTAKIWKTGIRSGGRALVACEVDQNLHAGSVTSVAFSPDGLVLCTGSLDNTLKVWEVSSGALQYTLEGHTDGVFTCSFSPDGATILSGSLDSTLKVWERTTGQFEDQVVLDVVLAHTLEGHSDAVYFCCYSPDGKTVLSASRDSTVKGWSLDGKVRHILEHDGVVSSCCWSPDGRSIVTASADASLKVWNHPKRLPSSSTVTVKDRGYETFEAPCLKRPVSLTQMGLKRNSFSAWLTSSRPPPRRPGAI